MKYGAVRKSCLEIACAETYNHFQSFHYRLLFVCYCLNKPNTTRNDLTLSPKPCYVINHYYGSHVPQQESIFQHSALPGADVK